MADNQTTRNSSTQSGPRGPRGPHSSRIENARDTGAALRRLLQYLQPYRLQLVGAGLLVIASTLLSLAGPLLIGRAVDLYIVPGDVPGLVRMAIVLLVVYISYSGATIGQGFIMVSISQSLMKDIRARLFNHLQTLSMKYHDEHEIGDLMSRLTNDTETINRVLSNGLTQFISGALTIVGIMVAMVVLNWQLALGTLLILPVMIGVVGFIAQHSRRAFRDVQYALGGLNAYMEENIAGVRVVKAFAREAETINTFEEVNQVNLKAGIRAETITAALNPVVNVMRSLALALVAGIGGWLAVQGIVTVGVLVSFIAYVRNFFQPLRQIATLYNQLQSALAGAERIFEVLDTEPYVQDAPDAIELDHISGHVVFDHVSFAYEEGKPVLEDVNLEALPGQTVALVGPTGAGKTTIISLLSRFYDVTEGHILIDGHDIRDVAQDSLRRQLGIVLQDTFLFSGTVMENIRYGRLDATDEEVIAAAKLANADQFITRLPKGYETPVSEQGSNFSLGQRQLLAIARAVLADPQILILDEATSSVDTRTEMQIQEALLRLMEGRTAFVIAHRLSTIREADQVLVINDHQVIERGTHQELLDLQGFYHNLYSSQFRQVA